MQKSGLDARKTARRQDAECSVKLWQRRAWYADEAGTGGTDEPADTTPDLSNAQNVADLPAWAQEEIRKARDGEAKKRVELNQLREKQAAEERERLAKQGEFETLYKKALEELQGLKTVAERAAALEAKIQETNAARIKRIPQQWHSAIPTGYTPEQLSAWLDANESLFVKKPAPNLDGGAGSDGTSTPTVKVTPEQTALAGIAAQLGYNVKPEALAERQKLIDEQRRRNPKQQGE